MNSRVLITLAVLFAFLFSRKAAASPAGLMKSFRAIKEDAWTRFDDLFEDYGEQFGVPWKLLKCVALIESTLGLNPKVALGIKDPKNKASISDDGLSWGLMQLRVKTAQDYEKDATSEKLNNPEISIRIAAKFFAWIMRQFDSKDPKFMQNVVMSYNQGVAGTKRGYTGAAPYWEKYKVAMVIVDERHPGE